MHYPRSDSNYQGENDNCEALAPFVMSLFDGQADEFEAKRARAHLLVCQTCAHRWLDWNRSRELLCSVPVPAPPPTQLWRILMACRLAAFSQQRSKRKTSTNYNGAPTDLSAQILARTTRAAAQVPPASSAKKWRGLAMPALAVPVMAMWLLVLQRDSFMATLPLQAPASIETEITVPHAAPRHSSVRSVAVSRPHVALAKAPAPAHAVRTEPVAAVVPHLEPREVPLHEVAWPAAEAAPEVVAVHLPHLEPATSSARSLREEKVELREAVALAAESDHVVRVAPPAVVKTNWTAPAQPRMARATLRPASLSDDSDEPHLRTARWKRVAPTVSHVSTAAVSGPDQVLRVSLPSSPAPAPTPARLLAENFDSDDSRVDEMRSVVDDFRATLAPDASTSTDTDDDLSRG